MKQTPLVLPPQPPCELPSPAAGRLDKCTAPGHPLLQLSVQDLHPPLQKVCAIQYMRQGLGFRQHTVSFYTDIFQDSVAETCVTSPELNSFDLEQKLQRISGRAEGHLVTLLQMQHTFSCAQSSASNHSHSVRTKSPISGSADARLDHRIQ